MLGKNPKIAFKSLVELKIDSLFEVVLSKKIVVSTEISVYM